jgi:hypothetical protein
MIRRKQASFAYLVRREGARIAELSPDVTGGQHRQAALPSRVRPGTAVERATVETGQNMQLRGCV